MKRICLTLLMAASMSAHALTPGSGTWVKETASYGPPNLQEAYVYVPKNPNPQLLNGKRALMLALHGCVQTAGGNVINNKYNWDATAEKYGMVVVAPTVPSGMGATGERMVLGCWDWFNATHSRTNRDTTPLKKLIDSVKSRSDLNIDPNQIYVTGLSSGATESVILGCMLPEYFAGVGSSAGPALGSKGTEVSISPTVSASQVAANCRNANGNSYSQHFKTQIFNAAWGASDGFVKPEHNVRNAEGIRLLYGMGSASGESFSVQGGGSGKQYRDENGKVRVSELGISGVPHAWSAGSGGSGGGQYVDYNHVNYPAFITEWFFKHNLRVVTIGAPTGLRVAGTTNNTIALAWNGVSGASGYNVYRDGAKVGSTPGTSFNDTGLNSGSTYNYVVKAVANGSESGPSNRVQGTTGGKPGVLNPPTGLSGTPTDTSIALTWKVVSGAKGYNVYRNGNKIGSSTEAAFNDKGLKEKTTYSYTVSSVNSAGAEGQKSAAIEVTTKASIAYSETVTAPLVNHFVAKRLTVKQYLSIGSSVGYIGEVTLYKCASGWTNHADCTPL